MWRAFFLAMGVATCILGAECLVVDRFVLASDQATPTMSTGSHSFQGLSAVPDSSNEMIPPEWAPWSLLSTGAVVILYSFTINRGGP